MSVSSPTERTGRIVARMTARRRDEAHRTSTPLELFFDLCFVVAVAQAGISLVHALAENHFGGVLSYLFVFFGIWWAWMNFSWFASAYDCDDVPYRLLTLLQMAGVLVFAAGVSRAFDDGDWTLTVVGYILMRAALTSQWLRASRGETGAAARTTRRYAAGLLLCQAGWVGLLFAPADGQRWVFALLALAELSVPVIAERDHQTSWHPEHIIAERYGLFTIIVLGETIAAATVAVKSGLDEHHALDTLLPTAAGGLLIVFAAWWIYFAVPAHTYLRSNRQSIPWGYGHYVVFAAAAAIGAGLEVVVEHAIGEAHISAVSANAAVTVPTAGYLAMVWLIHIRHHASGTAQATLPVTAVAVLACTYAGDAAVLLAGLICAAATTVIALNTPGASAATA